MDNQQIAEKLTTAIENNELILPTQPEVAVRIRECVEDPNVTSEKLAHVISRDPALTAKFIQIGNSPLNRGSVSITSLPNVINRLGFKYICNIATGLAMEQIFQATNDNIDTLMREAWASSSYVAAHAQVYAKRFSKVPSDTALLAGLMHLIGVLPILVYAQEHDELAENKELLRQLIKEHHVTLSELILKSWQFPDDITAMPSQLFKGSDTPNEEPSLVNIVEAALLKTHDLNKYCIEIEAPKTQVFEKLHLADEKPLNDDKFIDELEESMTFYCHR